MMKKAYLVLLFISLTFGMMVSCTYRSSDSSSVSDVRTETEDSRIGEIPDDVSLSIETSSETGTKPDSSALNAYEDVLLDNAAFFSTYHNESITLNQCLNSFIGYLEPMTISYFNIIDLDNDSIPEVVLYLNIGIEILHYQDGSIYGYGLVARAFMDLKTDGTFSFSSGSADNGFGTISFTNTDYKINDITYAESSIDSNGNMTVSYYVNQKSATEDEFEEAVNQEKNKPYAPWYDFTDDNIEAMLTP